MRNGTRVVVVAFLVAAAGLVMHADDKLSSQAAAIELRLGDLLFGEGRYQDSLEAYKRAVASEDRPDANRARAGLVVSALRVAEFDLARREAQTLATAQPTSPDALSLYGDALWAAGLFQEAETKYRDALAIAPGWPRGRNGLARTLLARSHLDEALNEAQAALRDTPRDLEIYHTVGTIYERMHRYEQAAAAYGDYANLLPNKDRSDRAMWSKAEIKFLKSFGQKTPFDIEPGAGDRTYTIDFRLVDDKIVVKARVNKGSMQDFVIDTGAENTVIARPTAQRLGVDPVVYTLSAGVGEVGLRGLELGRIDTLEVGGLKVHNVPCLIKNPPLRDLPKREMESLSPVSLGFSMTIDYKAKKLTFGRHVPQEPADFELPLWLYRLATVRGTVDGAHFANFVVDTGGEVISISHATAMALHKPSSRRIPLKVYGTSGWDRDAFLMPGVDLSFDAIQYKNFPVVVLNLDAPSALLGFQLGGIVGHRFLSKYQVQIDLDRSVLRLRRMA